MKETSKKITLFGDVGDKVRSGVPLSHIPSPFFNFQTMSQNKLYKTDFTN